MKKKLWTFVDISSIHRKLDASLSRALPGFHAFSGCDTTSGFLGKGKKTFCKEPVTNKRFDAMRELGETTDISTGPIDKCEEAICSIYGYKISDVNRVRYEMLIKGAESRDIQSTKDTLVLHTHRANYQTNIWKRSFDKDSKSK